MTKPRDREDDWAVGLAVLLAVVVAMLFVGVVVNVLGWVVARGGS